jgi:hypothetical protein
MESEKSLKESWKICIADFNGKKCKTLSIKELSSILPVSYSKIKYDIEAGRIPGCIKMGKEGTRADYIIPKWGAIWYVNSFPEYGDDCSSMESDGQKSLF